MAGTMTSYEDELRKRQKLAEQAKAPDAAKKGTSAVRTAAKATASFVRTPQAATPNMSSESYAQAVNALDKASARPTFANTYGDRLDELYEQIVNRPKFNYDVNADPLYQSLKDQHVQQGKIAMRDTVAQGAALTGGYDNTYAQQVGQQTYDAYLQNLAAAIPELYGQAREAYLMEGEALDKQYGMLGDLADDEYGKYRDALGDWQYDQQWQSEQQKYAYNNLYNLITNSGYTPSEDELRAAGMTAEEAASLKAEFQYNRDTAEKEYADRLAQQQWENEFRERQLAQDYELSLMRSYGGGGGGSSGGSKQSSSGSGASYGYSDVAALARQAAAGGAKPAEINKAVQQAFKGSGYTGNNTGNSDYIRAMRAAADEARRNGTYNAKDWRF